MCKKGSMLFVSGKVARFAGELQVVHPKVMVVDEGQDADSLGRIVPVYSEVEGVSQGALLKVMREAFQANQADIVSLIPEGVATSHGLAPLKEAFRRCHFPEEESQDFASTEEPVRRVILEDFFLLQTALLSKGKEARPEKGLVMRPGECHKHLMKTLPFTLTPGQVRVKREIERDMAGTSPMNRLLQGDVGCGKTVIAALAATIALDSGRQAVFMAPTEILAEQHYLSIHRMLEGIGVEPVLVRGNMGAAERGVILKKIAEGNARVVVGTHALLEADVLFSRLGLAVIDEQHRFGVIQRSRLKEKGARPHVLVMSATRSRERFPWSSTAISTSHPSTRSRPEGRPHRRRWSMKRRAKRCTMRWRVRWARSIRSSWSTLRSKNLIVSTSWAQKESLLEWRRLFPSLRIGLLHGRMKAEEKEEVMLSFREGAMDVLVCTTVIEVGIDVPNATLIVVEGAERSASPSSTSSGGG